MRPRGAPAGGGWGNVVFPPKGGGGPGLGGPAREGALAGVVDYTLSELANSLMDGIHATGPDRLTVVGEVGLPQVVVPGCVDFFNQGPPDTVADKYRRRRSYYHNPVATLVRLEPGEMAELGGIVAKRLNGARGPVSVVAPTR